MMNDKNCIGIGGSLGNQGIAQTFKETPVTRLDGALGRLRNAEKLVTSVANKLVGEREIDGANACNPSNPGIFGEIEDIADTISRLAGDIEYSANRIADRL